MKRMIVTAAALFFALSTPAFGQQTGTQKLYDRLGGMRGISVVVDDFINRLVINKTLNKNPAINAGRKSSPAPYLKFQVATLMCEVTGGPCKYTGRAMKESHAHLNITENEWNVMAGEFKKSLVKYKVPEAEQKELFDIVGKTKPDIVLRK
jgi:hemoglobin